MFALFQSINGVIDKLGSIADRKAYNGYLGSLLCGTIETGLL